MTHPRDSDPLTLWPEPPPDPIAPARGCGLGLVIGCALWVVVGLLVFVVLRWAGVL